MQLGVSVSPPGNKESITWDRLAGGCPKAPRPPAQPYPHISPQEALLPSILTSD